MLSSLMSAVMLALPVGSAPVVPSELPADSAAIAVVITDGATQKPLEGVEVRVGGVSSPFRTDYMGEVSFFRPRQSRLTLNIRLAGYTPIDTAFDVGAVDWMHIVLAMSVRAQPLAPAVVEAAAPASSHLAAFELRRSQGRGRYLTPAQLREWHDKRLIEALSRIPGVVQDVSSTGAVKVVARTGPTSVTEAGGGGYGYVVRGEARAKAPTSTKVFRGPEDGPKPGFCEIAVFVDAMYVAEPEIGTLRAAGFEAVEYYTPSNIPPEFKRPGTQCGVLLLWSK